MYRDRYSEIKSLDYANNKKSALNKNERNEWITLNHKSNLTKEEKKRLHNLTSRMRENN